MSTNRIALGLLLVLAPWSGGCISLLGPEDLLFRLSLAQGVGLDREFALGVDGLTASTAAALADMPLPFGAVQWVDVGMYKIRGDAPGLVSDAELPGWEPMVRIREDGEEIKVFVKQDRWAVRGVVALVREDDELVVVRPRGRVDRLIEKFLETGEFELEELLGGGSRLPMVVSAEPPGGGPTPAL